MQIQVKIHVLVSMLHRRSISTYAIQLFQTSKQTRIMHGCMIRIGHKEENYNY